MIKTHTPYLRRALTLTCAMAVTLLPFLMTRTSTATTAADKMKAEDVVAKHLESIGTEAARAGAQSRIVGGTSRAIFKARSSGGAVDGQVVIASANNKVVFGMKFGSPNYPGERFGFDGKKFTVGYLTPGVRSALGNFALTNGEIFKEGLIGGTLSSAWPLLNILERKAKLEYAGTDKINNLTVHKLRYSPNKGSDLQITLYFDANTFQHVRTQYERIIAARLGSGGVDSSASQRETRYKIIEDFGDYKQEGKLNLPHSYKLQLEVDKTGGSSMDRWEMTLDQFAFNEEIDDKAFNVEAD
ncbi:MAG: hypothetical protein QOE46_2291 [Acidobacteriota bacterium]|jgi:hypothetical protein|nr:hypothetical protein [Acidobacteriota bacterium]